MGVVVGKAISLVLSCGILALLTGVMATPCLASEYVVVVDKPDLAWMLFKEDLRPFNAHGFNVEIVQIETTPELEGGKQVNFVKILALLDCENNTFSFGGVKWLDENGNIVSLGIPPGNHSSAPVHPDADSPFAQALTAVCPANGPAWVHSDDGAWVVVRRKLASMKVSK
jgi:hypothetical protein